jgi:hypothetical protein
MQREWSDLVGREGTAGGLRQVELAGDGVAGDGELPCPACGTAAPLVDGACSDCGLQLE